jgi:enoyl-[acyl-carrier protein] reductase I
MTLPAVLKGRRGLVMGVANDHSIAWGIAEAAHRAGASLAFTYQGEALEKRVRPLAESVGASLILSCDVEEEGDIARAMDAIRAAWGGLDFVVHAVAFSDKNELKGRYSDTTRENFRRTMAVSCFSFTELARHAADLLGPGASLLTLTFEGAHRVMPNYNVMGVAKAALETSVRYLAADLGPRGVRVNAISAGPMRTLAGAAIGDARRILGWYRDNAPLGRDLRLDEVGATALYLLSPLASGVTGEVMRVDCGYHAMGMVHPPAAG